MSKEQSLIKKLEPCCFPVEVERYNTLLEMLSGNIDDRTFILIPVGKDKIPTGQYLVCNITAKG